ncbi:MAG: DUF4982 domain-containing protein [Oscillospiraceae bacterium]|nr:DUF4982 domain-containing protein [Oscillospiraceae bacterium]
MTHIEPLNNNWSFTLEDGSEPRPVSVPHDWLIGDAQTFYQSGVGRYTRELEIGDLSPGQRVSLRFDGVYMDSSLYVNGQLVGEWKYGYTAFEHDITDYIRPQESNTLLLTVNYHGQSARWYTGAGIIRDVWLITRGACRFAPDGIYVTTAYQDGTWTWKAKAETVTDGRQYEIRHTLIGAEQGIEAWDIENPKLYTLLSELIVGECVEDAAETRFGFRRTEFTPDRGFFLNGRPLKLKGVCLHHDLGGLGAAFNINAAWRQLELMRNMGVNAIRTSHNPPASAFMDLCDEMGFLVMSELTDMWARPKTPGDYARFFNEWMERDTASWIRRDRNRPSVILWSVGNEIHDTHIDPEGSMLTLRKLIGLVRRHDPDGHAPATLCSNYMPWENTQKCADIIKIIGYNYAERLYNAHHAEHPDWVIYGGETSSTVQSRGVYHFPLSSAVLTEDDLQCSALGNSSVSWGAKSSERCIGDDFDADFSLGQFIWTGQDYIGEPTPYRTKNSYFGQADTAGFAKDSYYIFKAAWTDYKTAPFVHIYPYWDFSPGQLIDVRVCTNAPLAALFLNGERVGETACKWIANWQIPYRPGVLRAEAYDESGAVVALMERVSFGDAASLHTEREVYGDLEFITVTARDAEGRLVENANCRAKVRAEGGTLLALDNGDSADFESYHADSRRLFNGKLLAIVRRDGNTEPRVTVTRDENDIPVRKIELIADDLKITAKLHPPTATYGDLEWRLTNAGGVDSQLAELRVSEDGRSVEIIPRGDGTAYVRASVKNGREHIAFYSQREIEFTGYGEPFIDPYTFVSGSLYNAGSVDLQSGNERGIAVTREDLDTYIGFTGLDFGEFGSDEITLGLFPFSEKPFDFEIWEGMPSDGGELLYTAHYDKGSVWDTYIDVTYTLPRRLRGITTLCLVFRRQMHIRGFRFTKPVKAFTRLNIAESDKIYGDSFTVRGNCVEGIGNNVAILYTDMDFGDAGASQIALRWRSNRPKNAMRVDFDGADGKILQMIELPFAEQYTERVFPLSDKVFGMNTVRMVFLPGCELDLEWVEFS